MAYSMAEQIERRQGEQYALHRQYLNTSLAKVQAIIGFDRNYTHGQGAYLWDDEGNRYLDLLAGYSVFNLGRGHPVVKQVMQEMLALEPPNLVKMDCLLLAGLLAEELVKRMPPGLDAVFCQLGRRRRGHRAQVRSCGDQASARSLPGPCLPWIDPRHAVDQRRVAVPPGVRAALARRWPGEDGRSAGTGAGAAPWGRGGFRGGTDPGKGVHIPADGYLPEAQRLCRRFGTLFVCDEVQVGMGRTGRFLCCEHWGLEPDVITLSKSLGGGYMPVSATITRRSIHDKMFSRLDRCQVHSTTFGQNDLAMAAGLATLHVLNEEQLIERAATMGQKLMAGLAALQERHELIADVRGKGLMVGIEFRPPRSLGLRAA